MSYMINNSQIFDKKTALNLGTLYPPKSQRHIRIYERLSSSNLVYIRVGINCKAHFWIFHKKSHADDPTFDQNHFKFISNIYDFMVLVFKASDFYNKASNSVIYLTQNGIHKLSTSWFWDCKRP